MAGRLVAVALALALIGICALAAALTGLPAAHADPTPTLTIQTPAPTGNTARGPLGTNITVQAQGANPSDSYQIGYAQSGAGCDSGFTQITNATTQAAADGSFTASFPWPVSFVGTVYYICAQDTTNSAPVIQSGQVFHVLAANMPAITVTPQAGADGTPAPSDGSAAPGEAVQVTGSFFLPGGNANNANLIALLLQNAANSPADFTNNAIPLTESDHATTKFAADPSGAFTVTLLLPSNLSAGQYHLYVTTTDGTSTTMPSLVATTTQPLTVAAPTPTPSPTSTPVTPTPVTTPATTPDGSNSGGPGKVVAVAGLGGLSVLLVVIGIIFLASAAATPQSGSGPDQRRGGTTRP